DWAAKDPSNAFITGLSTIVGGYTQSTPSVLAGNADVSAGINTTLTANTAITSLRFNENQSTTISLGSNTLSTGGILVTAAVGHAPSIISGGALQGPAFQDLVIIQNNLSNELTITSTISDNGASRSALTKAGPGALTLAGASTYSLGTFLNAGQINLNNASAIGFGPFTFEGGNIDNTSGGPITLVTRNSFNWNQDFTFVGSNDLNLGVGPVTLNGNRTVTVTGGTFTVGGAISGQGLTLSKAGPGVLSLTNAETVSGLNVNGGTVSSSGVAGSRGVLGALNSIAINSGGTVQFTSDNALTGTSGATQIAVSAGGTLAEANNATAHIAGGLNLLGGALVSSPAPGGNAAIFGTFLLDKGLAAGGVSATSTISAQDLALTQPGGTTFTVFSGASNGIDLNVTGTFFHASGSPDTGLIKAGSGVMRLSGTNTYTGPTVVSTGTLALSGSGSLTSPSITVSPGAELDVSTLGSGMFTLLAGQSLSAGRSSTPGTDINGNLATGAGSLIAGGNGAAGTLTINGNLTLNGGTVNLDLGNNTTIGSGQNDLIDTGNLSLNASTALAIKSLPGSQLASGTYTLIGYSGSVSGALSNVNATVNSAPLNSTRTTYLLGESGSSNAAITLTVSNPSSASLTWAGDGVSNVWNVKGASNFKNGGGSDVFYNLDSVTFDDSGSGTPAVTLSGNLAPLAVTVSDATTAYTFGGTGSIVGSASLTKSGAAALTLATSNAYTGGTVLNAGQLNINSASAIGTGLLTISGGTIDNTSGAPIALTTNNTQSWLGNFAFGGSNSLDLGGGAVTMGASRTVTVNGAGVLTVDGAISGSGSLTKAGSGSLTLNGQNTYSGGTVVSGGTLTLGAGGQNGAILGNLTINSGATVNASTNWSLGFGNGLGSGNVVKNLTINGGALNFYGAPASGGITAASISLSGGSITGTSFDIGNDDAGGYSPVFNINAGSTTSVISSGFRIRMAAGDQLNFSVTHTTLPSDNLLISGPITSDAATPVSFSGGGTTELSGANTYTGNTLVNVSKLILSGSSMSATTVENTGALVVSGSLSGSITTGGVGRSTIEVQTGGLLSGPLVSVVGSNLQVDTGGTVSGLVAANSGLVTGNGRFTGGVSLVSGSTLAPGQNGPGSLAISGNLSLTGGSGSTLALDLDGIFPGTQYDQLVCSGGTVDLGGSLQLTLGYTPTPGDVFYMILNSGGSAVDGVFSNGIDQGNGTALIFATGTPEEFLVSYTANASVGGIAGFAPGQGDDVALLALGPLPEPTSMTFILGTAGVFAGLGRFRRQEKQKK
ncbi:MAG TPA: autotransporter-associated beta strand repeat-containing protein, partial [Chthoniobacteraceae bacterium]